MTQSSLTCFILAGGSGSRLWPLSQPEQPKPCLTLPFLEDSLLSLTLQRVRHLLPESIGIITHADCVDAIDACLLQQPLPPMITHVIVEPSRRNTAPAIALALTETDWDEDALCFILPSDQMLDPLDAFTETVRHAQTYMDTHQDCPFMLFGLTPTHPSSRFGYIATRDHAATPALAIDSFIEKPQPDHALALMAQSGAYWNSGLILCRPQALKALLDQVGCHGERETFASMPALSIDHALWHSHAHLGQMIPLHCQWHDVGTWQALLSLAAQKPEHQALLASDTIVISTEGEKPVRCVGVENVLVVNTPDGLLIMNRDELASDVPSTPNAQDAEAIR